MGVLFYLLRCTNKGSEGRHQQARLYRMTEFVGRWSMVDLYVVILLVALVQFGLVANVEPGGAALAFGGVVILTMLAAETFDPRLLWDRGHESKLN
jgi:paraquat-inducible protein A